MGPEKALPHSNAFANSEEYVDSLLNLVSTNDLLRTLCGGVHVLDFFTTTNPDLYSRVIPQSWQAFFRAHDIMDILDLLMREDLNSIPSAHDEAGASWRNGPPPPSSLRDYIQDVRKHLLSREPSTSQCSRNRAMKPTQKLARHVAVGMNVKKVHEVGLFAHYIDDLARQISCTPSTTTNASAGNESGQQEGISHLVDFGSGQNYLGRALASAPYNRSIVAIESRAGNEARAREFDVMAKLATRERVMRNKKAFRAGLEGGAEGMGSLPTPTPPPEDQEEKAEAGGRSVEKQYSPPPRPADATLNPLIETSFEAQGRIQYISHRIACGDLSRVIRQLPATPTTAPTLNLLVMSLHSCGNLVHHGLRSLLLNHSVKAVALVGCCYNLLTERLGPATYKLPELRPTTTYTHPRLLSGDGDGEGEGDPDGFPMSARLCQHHPNAEKGVKLNLNITARMMAVQAPSNWQQNDSERFFTRHFYRAVLQRIFLDRGVVGPPASPAAMEGSGGSPAGHTSSGGTPIVIGKLRKACYTSFVSYVRGALEKLYSDPDMGAVFRQLMAPAPPSADGEAGADGSDGDNAGTAAQQVLTDQQIAAYEQRYLDPGKKDLSVIWSLMAFSAGVIEATIVVDRWLWLMEQKGGHGVREAWVEPVFAYGLSPRNLVVVGVKG